MRNNGNLTNGKTRSCNLLENSAVAIAEVGVKENPKKTNKQSELISVIIGIIMEKEN